MSGERTEKASEQRKKKSREKGEGPRSRDLTASAAMLAGMLMLRGAAESFVHGWSRSFTSAINVGARPMDTSDALGHTIPFIVLQGVAPVAAVLVAALAASLALGAAQSGGLSIHGEALAMKWTRLNPASNIKNLFSGRSLVRLMKSLLPAAAVVTLASTLLRRQVIAMPVYSMTRLPMTFGVAYQLALDAAWISLAWSAIDYINEWRQWNGGLKMTKEEVKQEIKQSNGNPQVKGRIRQIQRAMRRRRVKADVSRAAVVITNPTHYAVALTFDYEEMAAPKVLVKGRDLHALDIREQARWAGVPIVENPPLARSLYRSVEEGQSIPFELYAAVAAILAFLFRQSRERAEKQARTGYGYAEPQRTVLPVIDYMPPEDSESQ